MIQVPSTGMGRGLLAVLLIAGCLLAFVVGVRGSGQAPTTAAAPSAPPATTAPATPDTGWRPSGQEEQAEIKQVASGFVERVGSWSAGESRDPAARVIAAGYPADLAVLAGPLLDVDTPAAVTTVRYPQLGGLTERSASVIVAARQQLGTTTREVTVDIRAVRDDAGWRVSGSIDPARPDVVPARPDGPTPVGQAVLDTPGVELHGPARRDIEERRVSDGILTVVAALADSYELEIQVAVTGHPGTVFPRSRVSNHAVGRAVDIRAIDGRPVVDIPRDDPVLAEVMAVAARTGATEVGGPIAIPGPAFFTDQVHQDHLHLGISAGR